jgi:hypothetical protein
MSKLPKMRIISCAKTTQSVRDRFKDVTRRWGWAHAVPGMFLRIVDRQRYRNSDPPQVTLAVVEAVDVHRITRRDVPGYRYDEMPKADDMAWLSLHEYREELASGGYSLAKELAREGLPQLTAYEFVELLTSMVTKKNPPEILTRIQWRYREDIFELWNNDKRAPRSRTND